MKKLAFVSFQPFGSSYESLVAVPDLSLLENPEVTLRQASEQYCNSVTKMKSLAVHIDDQRRSYRPISARSVWRLGNEIIAMVEHFRKLSVQIDGLYDHLARDIGMKRKRLEKVVILRRYLPTEALIPDSLNWGALEKGTRRKALLLLDGISVDSDS
jgi:hypothetical protein